MHVTGSHKASNPSGEASVASAGLAEGPGEKDNTLAEFGHVDDQQPVARVPEGPEGPAPDPAEEPISAMEYYLDPGHLVAHVQDSYYFEIPMWFGGKLYIPNPLGFTEERPMVGVPENDFILPLTLRPSKFMIIEVTAAIIVCALFIWAANRIKTGDRPRGRLWNLLEVMLLYIRNEVVRPAIGRHDADRFLPFIWTVFFFVLTMNLLGLVPMMGSPTGALGCTLGLALMTFCVVVASGVKRMGVVGFLKAQSPHMELPAALAIVLVPMIWLIEMFGFLIKHLVLAVRLFANMFAGHLIVGAFLAFIGVTWGTLIAFGTVPAAVAAATAINLLELLVAFIQAYVFTFLSALFIGAALHHH